MQCRPAKDLVGWPHAAIDNKGSQIMLNKDGRSHAARRRARGAYRAPAYVVNLGLELGLQLERSCQAGCTPEADRGNLLSWW